MPLIPQTSTPNRRTCMLMVTHACNLNCTYCYERYKDDAMMTFETAKSCILKEVEFVKRSDKYKELEVDFMGGEPLMNFALIQQVVEWMEQAKLGVPFITFATSNGTLVTDEKKPWLEAHRATFCIGLSYDGNASMQKVNRGSEPLDLDWYIRIWPWQGMRMTISKETLPNLADGILSIQRKGGVCTAALAQGVLWTEEDACVYSRELEKLAAVYLNDFSLRPIEPLLTRPLFEIGAVNQQKRFCGAADGMVTYDVDGASYPCHMFSPIVLGNRASPLREDLSCDYFDDVVDGECVGCSFANWCPTCYGFNYAIRGDLRRRDHGWCKMINAQVVKACEFQVQYYYARINEIGPEDSAQVQTAVRVLRMIRKGMIHVG